MQESPRDETRRPPFSLVEKIDLCRGLFAALVVIAHAFDLARAVDPGWDAGMPTLAADFLLCGIGTGVYYVMGFFILSGYCIHESAWRLTVDGRFPLRAYLIARATRILPLYYAALLFAVAVEAAAGATGRRPPFWPMGLDLSALAGQVVLAQGVLQSFGAFAASWSITNEAAYYLLFGLIAAACVPLRARPAVVGMAICTAGGLALQLAYRVTRDPVAMRAGMLVGLGAVWHLGALVADYAPRLAATGRIAGLARAWPAALAATMALHISRRSYQEFVFVAAGVSFAMMLVHFVVRDGEARASGSPPPDAPRRLPVELGLASYPIYLFHGPLLIAFGTAVGASGPAPPWWAVWPSAALFALGGCLPLGRLLERPLLAWRSGVMERVAARERGRTPDPLAVGS